MDNLIGERMKSEIFERLNNNKEPTVRAVAVLYSDGTIDSIDQITNYMLSTHDGNDEIIISGKYHAFIAKGSSSDTKLSFMGGCMKNNETTVMVTEDQFYMLKILNKLGLLKITRSWTNGMTYYVTVERKDEN